MDPERLLYAIIYQCLIRLAISPDMTRHISHLIKNKKRKCNEICQPANQKNDATQNVNCFSALRPENFSAVDMAANES